MWDWIAQHSTEIQTIVGIITALVWLIYLQIFITSYQRQKRSEILIHLGGRHRASQQVLVSNLGHESIYLLEILLTLERAGDSQKISIVDRAERDEEEAHSLAEVTFQGPLKSGEFLDIGTFDVVLKRAGLDRRSASAYFDATVTVAAVTATTPSIIAAYRKFRIAAEHGDFRLIPHGLYATQVRSWCGRRKIERLLHEAIAD